MSSPPLPAQHPSSFSLLHIFFSLLLNLNIATNVFWWNLLMFLLYAMLKCISDLFFFKNAETQWKFLFFKRQLLLLITCSTTIPGSWIYEPQLSFQNWVKERESDWERTQTATFPMKLSSTARQITNHDPGIRIIDQNKQNQTNPWSTVL